MHKREFLRTLGGASIGISLHGTVGAFLPAELLRYAAERPASVLAEDEAFWTAMRAHYAPTTEYVNLENGYYSVQAGPVLEAFITHVRRLNVAGSRYMRTALVPDKTRVRDRLAVVAGCAPDELIITRNTTESLDTVIAGYDWKPGDEAVMAAHDYGAMLDMFRLQARRYGMVNRVVDVPLHPASDDDIVRVYADAITPRTRLLMLCHLVNITGQILPVRAIADMAHARGVDVMVDGAHAFAQLDFRIPDLGVDYYGASLHKWLGAPLGAGLLYVRRDKIAGLWATFADASMADTDIRKLNHTGTHPAHTDLAIENAIAFHEGIGIARKEARLRFLQQYWTAKARAIPGVVVNTPADPSRACAIANVGIPAMKPRDLMATLFDKYHIWTVGIDNSVVRGVRVTPHVYTTVGELDRFVRALGELARA
jgi:selenocysteine lyase/cysteine desulfurase